MENEETTEVITPVPGESGQTVGVSAADDQGSGQHEEAATSQENAGEGDEGSTADTQTEEDEHGKKTPRGVQKRLDELTKEKYEWKREADYWREQAQNRPREEASQGDGKSLQDGKPPSPNPAEKPNPDNYDTYDDYVEALTDWKTEQKFSQVREKAKRKDEEAKTVSERQLAQQEFSEAIEASKSKHPDFEATILSATNSPCTPDMLSAMMSAADGAEIMYFLAKNPAEATRISKLSPISQIREIGRIEHRLATPPKAPEPKRITNTTEPVKTVSGAGVSERDPQKMSMEDYAAWRMSGART